MLKKKKQMESFSFSPKKTSFWSYCMNFWSLLFYPKLYLFTVIVLEFDK